MVHAPLARSDACVRVRHPCKQRIVTVTALSARSSSRAWRESATRSRGGVRWGAGTGRRVAGTDASSRARGGSQALLAAVTDGERAAIAEKRHGRPAALAELRYHVNPAEAGAAGA